MGDELSHYNAHNQLQICKNPDVDGGFSALVMGVISINVGLKILWLIM